MIQLKKTDQIISVLYSDIFNVKFISIIILFLAILSGVSISLTLFSISTIKTIITMLVIGIFYILTFKSIIKTEQNGKKFVFIIKKQYP